MTPTLTIAIVAFVLLLSIPGAAAKRRRIGSGSSTYCVDDQNQRVPCVSSIIGAVIGGLFLLLIIIIISVAIYRRRRSRRRMALLPTTTTAKDHPETSTIASGSTFPYTVDPIVQPPPAYMGFPHPEPDNRNTDPKVAPVGTYATPQGPPPAK